LTTPENPWEELAAFESEVLKEEPKDAVDEIPEEELQSLLAKLIEVAVAEARQDFYVYTKLMAPVLLPEGYKDGKHIEMMCRELEKIEQSVVNESPQRLQIFLPPGSMKSKLLNLFVTWCFGRHPKWNILHIGHSTEFAHDNFGRQIRDLIRTPEYHSIFPETEVRQDVRASGRWATTKGGQYFATGVGTRIAGRRAHISLCDDVVSEQTAYSKIEREKINNWYVPGLRSRLLSVGAEVIVNTRWHMEDLSGYLTKVDATSPRPWKIISIPAILDEKSAELLGLKAGESFWPELWPSDRFEEMRASDGMTKQVWASLYMQNPIPDEGAIISPQDIMIWDHEDPPSVNYVVISMDTAFSTSQRADYSAITVWGVFKQKQVDYRGNEVYTSNMVLIDAKKGRWTFPELCEQSDEMNRKYLPDLFLIEKKASGQSLIQELKRRMFPIKEYLPDRDKETRLHACVPFFEAHRIWFPKRKWADEVITELTSFPHVPHDDYVDTTSQAVLWMRDRYVLGNEGYSVDEEEDEDPFKKRKTYWSQLTETAVV
jgi:predicted phage terminase large subunit-like protein